MRLQKFLAQAGVTSRRKAEVLISSGRVKINGEVISKQGVQVDASDKIELDNKVVRLGEDSIYIMLNKPEGYLSVMEHGREEGGVLSELVDVPQRLYPVGRLDRDSSGLLLLTNDGDLALKLTHPRYEKEKEYLVQVNKELLDKDLVQLKRGVVIDGYKTLPAKVTRVNNKTLLITIKEGKNRQVRKMCQKLGYLVVFLQRLRINNLKLGNLALGKWRNLTKTEIQKVKIENEKD